MAISTTSGNVSKRLLADVADGGTFTVAYPSGESASTFGLAVPGSFSIFVNDTVTLDEPEVEVSLADDLITVTNESGITWTGGTLAVLSFTRGEIKAVPISQAAYDALGTPDPLTLYLIPEEV